MTHIYYRDNMFALCMIYTVCMYHFITVVLLFEFGSTVEPLNKDTFGTSHFVLCREVVFFQRRFSIECVYKSTFGLSFVGRLFSFGVSFIGGFTVRQYMSE